MKQGKISLVLIVIVVIALVIVMSGLLTVVSPFEFAGFAWKDSGEYYSNPSGSNLQSFGCGSGGSSGNINNAGEFVEIKHSSSNYGGSRYIETDITGIDEILIIYEGYASATANCDYGGTGAGIFSRIKGASSGAIENINEVGSQCRSTPSVSSTFAPAIWKFKNNFDGTWSTLQSLNVGDVFIVKDTKAISGNAILQIGAYSGASCGSGGSANAYAKIYNVVRKENAFAVCKADKYAYDANSDGRIATDGTECFDLKTIVLNSEEAIRESYDEKLARITAEIEAKNAGLTSDIAALQQQLAQQQGFDDTALKQELLLLQAELKEAKSILTDVRARDPVVINTIISQEQFKKPNFIAEFFNKIIAWLKNLFS